MDTPDDATFGDLIDRKAREQNLDNRQVSALIGLLSNRRPFDHNLVGRIRKNERKHYTAELVQRLIEVLEMTPAETMAAWRLSGLLPPGTNDEDVGIILARIADRHRRRSDRELPDPPSGGLRPASATVEPAA